MSVLEIETSVRTGVQPGVLRRAGSVGPGVEVAPGPRRTRAPKRPSHGRGRTNAPRLRPARTVPAPTIPPAERSGARACTAEPRLRVLPTPTVAHAARWRLTDRGIAVVLVTVAMVTVAALAVLVPTALRVTGDSYQPIGSSQPALP